MYPPPRTYAAFRNIVLKHYRRNGRDFLWRRTIHPYRILVSEVMLQQTQASRVAPKYEAFLQKFPTFKTLARAPLGNVLRAWQGLGHNRRALALQKTAREVMLRHNGKLPRDERKLERLPGIGPYTARAVLAFAFNVPTAFLETNIRTVFVHHFFKKRRRVADEEILPLVAATLDRENPRRWYAALMDYGAFLKKTEGNLARKSAHYKRQSPFEGSNRQLRGQIIRALTKKSFPSARALATSLGAATSNVKKNLRQLEREGMVRFQRDAVRLS
jgi:A/G-specific adenine glycosylase